MKPTPSKRLALCVVAPSLLAALAQAGTVAYWRFEEGPAGANVPKGGLPDGTFYPGVSDSSGNNNPLSAWSEGGGAGFAYNADTAGPNIPGTGAANSLSVKNTGGFPAMWTETGGAMQTWQPSAWTIEFMFQPELTDGYRTIVGRDSRGSVTTGNLDLAALYFQVQPDESLAIKFSDVSGYWHEAISVANLVQGFVWAEDNGGLTGQWQGAAAVCDGSTLWLYYQNIEAGGPLQLVAQTDLTLSGSPDTTLTMGTGDGGDWDAGNWSVGRGLYAGGHGDRGYGFIDEVRISDTALSPAEFLFVPEPGSALLGLLGAGLLLRRRRS